MEIANKFRKQDTLIIIFHTVLYHTSFKCSFMCIIATSNRKEECDQICFEQRNKSDRLCFRKSLDNNVWQTKRF